MKKIISMVCIFLLLVATSNLAVHIHFCGSEISSVDFYGKSKGCANGCDPKTGVIKGKSCCKTIATIINTDDTTNSGFSFQTEQQAVAIIPVALAYAIESSYTTELLKGFVACNAPPSISGQPYYILYRSLII